MLEGDGAPLRKHLQRYATNTGRIDPRLLLECPRLAQNVWRAFTRMRRAGGLAGPQPLSNLEIDAWQRVNRTQLTPWELDCIYALDEIAMEELGKADDKT